MTRALALATTLLVLPACEQQVPQPSKSIALDPPAPSARAAPAPRSKPLGAENSRLPQPERLVAVGDLHGDLEATRDVLRLAGAIDEADRWVGGNLILVQTGDQIDRGDDDRAVLDLLERLVSEARASGGALHVLNGNHETMNAAGDFRYVTQASLQSFDGADPRKLPSAAERLLPEPARPRAAAFLPGGVYAKKLAERPIILIVGDSVFVHGGVLPAHVDYGIDRLNAEVSEWLLGNGAMPKMISAEDAPVWARTYSEGTPSESVCRMLEGVLERLVVSRMVVGHTVQKSGITSACGDQVYRIDVGLSRYYGGESVSALEIGKSGVRVLTRARSREGRRVPEAAE